MNHSPNDHEKLERLIQQTLRGLPARRAPLTLEHRVFAELGRRAALPWWHKSYAFWPEPVRAVFFVLSAAVAAFAVAALFALTRGGVGTEAASEAVAQLAGTRGILGVVVDKTMMIFYAIPTLWLYSGIALVVSCYVTLIGIGAVAYRTMRAHR
jgi:hypothetical protein